jgi:high affinity Mn2+ porin
MPKLFCRVVLAACLPLASIVFAPADLLAQESSSIQASATAEAADSSSETDSMLTMLPHLERDRFWISGQANFISQWHPGFHSPYAGPNSLSAAAQDATSRVLTLFTGARLSGSTEFIFDVQETGGNGIGAALGVAGFPNLDVVRNPTLSKAPYVARLMWHQVIPLSGKKVVVDRTPFALFPQLPESRLEVRFGKFSLADFFDLNTYGTDSNFQFMNWTVDDNGAYDYAADTRGFTFAAMLEYHDRFWAVRFSEALMPKVANGIRLEADLARARSENAEWEMHGSVLRRRAGTVRLLSFVNHANMGSYREAIDNFLANLTPVPEITAHPGPPSNTVSD